MDERLKRLFRSTIRNAGRRYAEARDAYREGRLATAIPEDEEGRARIVCRRYAERRAVVIDETGCPACYEADHPDCEGCVEDVREGCVETW